MPAALIVKHRVANYDTWKAGFDSVFEKRKAHGWRSAIVLRDATDPNLVTIVNRVKDLEGAKRYGSSPELRALMEKIGVLGAPEISFMEEVEDRAY
ncbi:MAG TPA: hypothetical protein VHM19_19645 [Polyangiales bacterium]|nr:hypothetical protein [Polyangiales bacterium]